MAALPDPQQEAFAQARLAGKTADEAYVLAGYKQNRSNASRLNRNPAVVARIAELQAAVAERVVEASAVTKERVLEELAKLGFSNMLDYVAARDDGFVHLDLSQLTRDQAAAIQEVVIDEYNERVEGGDKGETRAVKKVRFKLADKRGALVDIGKHLGMFTEKVELAGKNGGPIETKEIGNGRELARRIAFALERAARAGPGGAEG